MPPPAPWGPRFRRSALRFGIAAAVIAVLAVGAGLWLGRAQPEQAARIVVREFVLAEDAVDEGLGPDPIAPTSGSHRGPPTCGLQTSPMPPPQQVETLASGVVVLQHGASATDADREVLAELATRRRVAVAPNPDLEQPVIATAWRHRMVLDRAAPELLQAFITGHADRSPDPRPCPGEAP